MFPNFPRLHEARAQASSCKPFFFSPHFWGPCDLRVSRVQYETAICYRETLCFMWLVLFTRPGLQCSGRVERVEGRLQYSQVKRSQHAVAQYLPSVPCLSQSYIDRKLCFCARRVRCLILRGILVSWVKLTSVEQFVVEKVRSSLY